VNTLIRRASPDDAHAIADIHVAASRAAYRGLMPEAHLDSFTVERRETTWREILASGDGDTWVAEDEAGRPLGWIHVGSSRDPEAAPTTGELRAMYIEPPSWRRGIGRALWEEAERDLSAHGFTEVTLWVFRDNAGALAFYRQLGFTEDAEVMRPRAGVPVAELRMRRPLP